MKVAYLLLIISTLICCNSESKTVDNEKDDAILKYINITDNTAILGSWNMCSNSSNEQMFQYNVCPTVLFKYNGTGTIEQNSAIKENFQWTLKEGVLTINNSNPQLDHTFSDTTYMASIIKNENAFELTISQQKLNLKYYLSKQIQVQ